MAWVASTVFVMGGPYSIRGVERQPIHGADMVVGAIKDEARAQIANPLGGDPFIPPMWEAALHLEATDPRFREFLEYSASDQNAIVEEWTVGGHPISEINSLLRTLFQEHATRYGPRLPRTFRGWVRSLSNQVNDPASLDRAKMLIANCSTMTNADSRYGPFEVIRVLKGGPGCFLDAASSIGLGARRILLKEKHPFVPVFLQRNGGDEDMLAAQGYASLVAAPLLPRNVLMTDIVEPDNKLAQRVELASNRPTEIMDPGFRRERRELLRARLANLAFEQSDLTKRRTMGRVRELCQEWQIRTAFLGTALNQIGQEFVDLAIDNVLWALDQHDDTEVVVADFIERDRRDPGRLFLLPQWQMSPAGLPGDYPYNYFGVRLSDRGKVNRLFGFSGSRPRRGAVGDGIIAVHGEAHVLRELMIARAAGAASVGQITSYRPDGNTCA